MKEYIFIVIKENHTLKVFEKDQTDVLGVRITNIYMEKDEVHCNLYLVGVDIEIKIRCLLSQVVIAESL